ncbi:MAG TPA: hypothetical protein PKD91_02145, partial [Bacteroidia bacterium]|nr:hypothetical protein [Bacteroidia bacterium]
LYFVIVFVFVFKYLINSSPRLKWIVYLLPFLVILENMIQPEPHKSYVKTESQNKIQTIKNYIIAQHNKEKYTAIAYCPIEKYSFSREDQYSEMLETHLNVMLASQELFIPCVNGYTGFDPGNFIDFFNFPGKETIANWAKFNRTNGDRIQIISEIGKVELNRSVINLKTKNNKYLCADENLNDLVVANKDHALSWETFKIIYFEDNLCVIRSHKNLFFSLISQQNNSIAATSSKISQNEIFTIEKTNSNEISLKAANGKYLIVDPNDNNLKASGDNIQLAEKLIVSDFVESK